MSFYQTEDGLPRELSVRHTEHKLPGELGLVLRYFTPKGS